jgi:hypothetical protein
MTDSTNPSLDAAMRSVTIEIPTAVAQRITESFEGTLEGAARAGLQLINGMGPTTYSNLQELAKQLDTTPAKALRSAIQLLTAESARLSMTRGAVGRPKINEHRDAQLYERIKSGRTQAEVAAEFSLSIVRVGQIVAQHRAATGDAPRRGRGSIPNPRKSHGQPNLMRMYDEIDGGISVAVAAQVYGMDEHRVRELYDAYKANLPTKPTVSDKVNASLAATQAAAQTDAQEVLTLKEPEAPRKLAVIPPSMKNPELFAEAKPIKIPDPAKVDVSMFADDYPL